MDVYSFNFSVGLKFLKNWKQTKKEKEIFWKLPGGWKFSVISKINRNLFSHTLGLESRIMGIASDENMCDGSHILPLPAQLGF